MYKIAFKPLFDFFIALIAFVIFLPIFIIIIVLLTVSNSGKPFFTQVRPGKNAKLFKLIKFKTMNDRRGKTGKLLPDKERLTSIGKFIRSTSLDEIPQLLNVIKGEMSLIGPRPLLVKYLERYTPVQARRLEVKPGITGWAQINGRNSISWEKKFEYDIYYVENLNFNLDIKILALTIKKVFFREGINSDVSTTMTEFKGNEK